MTDFARNEPPSYKAVFLGSAGFTLACGAVATGIQYAFNMHATDNNLWSLQSAIETGKLVSGAVSTALPVVIAAIAMPDKAWYEYGCDGDWYPRRNPNYEQNRSDYFKRLATITGGFALGTSLLFAGEYAIDKYIEALPTSPKISGASSVPLQKTADHFTTNNGF